MIERYALSPMKELWKEEAQYERWLEVELACLAAMEEKGEVPAGTHAAVEKTVRVDLERIEAIEGEIKHDLLAFLRSLEEQAGKPGRFLHRGLTSSDVKDTALSLAMRDGLLILLEAANELGDALLERAHAHQDLVIVGRTHGMHAEPTTLGLKFFLWHEEIGRDIARLARAKETLSVGKLSGPVGTYSQVSPEVEQIACRALGLEPARVANQVLQRDRHAEGMAAIAITGATLEKIALEIRHLSRTEIGEVEEPSPEGSSSMPHKQNPIRSERICGLARLLRANLQAALENVALWHERDMSHSSVERIILPESFLVLHYMLVTARDLVAHLVVHPERITQNLALTQGAIHSQALLLALVEQGMARAEAHERVKAASERARAEGVPLLKFLKEDPKVARLLHGVTPDEEGLLERLRATSRRIIGKGNR
jgi:adenylosuccinate lyase